MTLRRPMYTDRRAHEGGRIFELKTRLYDVDSSMYLKYVYTTPLCLSLSHLNEGSHDELSVIDKCVWR